MTASEAKVAAMESVVKGQSRWEKHLRNAICDSVREGRFTVEEVVYSDWYNRGFFGRKYLNSDGGSSCRQTN